MAKKRKNRRKYTKSGGSTWNLGDTSAKESHPSERMQLGLSVLSFVAGQAVGAAVGKTSGYVGSVITGLGIWKKNMYATSFGAGMTLSEANGPSGFSLDNIKERSVGFLKNVGGKFIHPMGESENTTTTTTTTDTGANGLGEGEEQPKYFLNPYTQNTDFNQAMKDLEKIEAEVRGISGIEDEELNATEENY